MGTSAFTHHYTNDFFDSVNAGSLASARVVCPLLVELLEPESLLDVGCGAGAWCKIWRQSGVEEVIGVDGDYVRAESLLMPAASFRQQDLVQPFDLKRRFDLVTSLEVAEHVAESSADALLDNLTRHGDRVLFSAAVKGQGGEFHVNEQSPDYWRARFADRDYGCFDALRHQIATHQNVEPWYRYNTLLYVHERAAEALPREVAATRIPHDQPIPSVAPLTWRARNAVIGTLPPGVVSRLVAFKHAWVRRWCRGA